MSGRRLLLASANQGKLRELRAMLDGVEVLSLRDVGIADLEEPFDDFVANASTKATQASALSGLPALADDSGLAVDALGGAPGVFSARFSGAHGDDAANRALLLDRMRAVDDGARGARFRCVLALADVAGALGSRVLVAQGACGGAITRAPRGDGGFGYDPLFVPLGLDRTMAELRPEEKATLSHRARALRAMRPTLRAYLGR